MTENKTSAAQIRAVARYTAKFDRITARLDAGTVDRIKAAGENVNEFVRAAVAERLERYEAPAQQAPAGYDKQAILDSLAKVPGIGKRALDRAAEILP